MFFKSFHGILLELASPSRASLHFRRPPDTIGLCSRMFFHIALIPALIFAASDMRAAAREQTPEVGVKTVVRADRRTGRLVRRVVVQESIIRPKMIEARPVAVAHVSAAPANPIGQVIEQVSQEQGVDPLLVHAVIHAESRYNKYAISPKGAEGLMQ